MAAPVPPTAVVHRRDGEAYRELARFGPAEVVRLAEPFPVDLDLAALAR